MEKEAWGVFQSLIAAGSGLTGVWFGGHLTSQREKKRQVEERRLAATYLAALVLAHLDRFVEGCVDVAYDDGTSEGRPAGESGYHQATSIAPVFDPLSLDVDWKSISPELMYDLLNLPHRTLELQRFLSDPGFEDPPDHLDYFLTRQQEFTQLGLDVTGLAARLRSFADLPLPPRAPHGQSREALLQERMEHLSSTRRELSERRAAFAALAPLAPPIAT